MLPLIFSFIFGAIIGSFLNVVSLRFNTGSTLGGRSKCMSCGESLTWKELVPVFSFLFQKGACRKCKSRISWQYPLVEFLAGAAFVLIFIAYPPVSPLAAFSTLFYMIATCLLLVIAAYDMKHMIIPDRFVWAFDGLAFIGLFIGGAAWLHAPYGIWTLLAGPILAAPFALLWLVSKGRWMGLGDAKLMLGIGWILGLGAGVNAAILAFWIGAVASVVILIARHGRLKARTEIPFGPYLILGMYIVLFFHVQVLDTGMLRDIVLSYL